LKEVEEGGERGNEGGEERGKANNLDGISEVGIGQHLELREVDLL